MARIVQNGVCIGAAVSETKPGQGIADNGVGGGELLKRLANEKRHVGDNLPVHTDSTEPLRWPRGQFKRNLDTPFSHVDAGIDFLKPQVRGNLAFLEHFHGLDQTSQTACSFQMTDVGLD